ncbi:Uncharacterised protein [Streptococcus pneumoniae]|nr:Uncharacterised protein [Streptococcus pneumoniae]
MEGLKASVSASAAFAPPDSPNNPGSASGFRVNPCIIAPETANPAPTKIAATSRGKRISRIIDILSPLAEEVSANHTSFIEVSAAPNTIATIKIRKNAIKLKISLYVKAIERGLS